MIGEWNILHEDVVHDLRSNYEDQHDMPVEVGGDGIGAGSRFGVRREAREGQGETFH